MTPHSLTCWKCGASLSTLPLPLSRLSECPQCRAYLHCCRLCRHYDPRSPDRCREERAEHVRDRESANFCDWFSPQAVTPAAGSARKAGSARAGLDALFGGDASSAKPSANPLDELFKNKKP
jgi:hypothetical protein